MLNKPNHYSIYKILFYIYTKLYTIFIRSKCIKKLEMSWLCCKIFQFFINKFCKNNRQQIVVVLIIIRIWRELVYVLKTYIFISVVLLHIPIWSYCWSYYQLTMALKTICLFLILNRFKKERQGPSSCRVRFLQNLISFIIPDNYRIFVSNLPCKFILIMANLRLYLGSNLHSFYVQA